jgi:hypothetical protein
VEHSFVWIIPSTNLDDQLDVVNEKLVKQKGAGCFGNVLICDGSFNYYVFVIYYIIIKKQT